jgi:COP9 signalosome complex subunit 6
MQALLNRLPLVVPADVVAFEHARIAERSDVSLIDLLGHVSKSVRDTKEVGRKFGILEQARAGKKGPMIANDEYLLPGEKMDHISQW